MDRGTTEKKGKGKAPKRKPCPHGIEKYVCIPCGGAGICVHERHGKTVVRNVKVAPFVCMKDGNTLVRNVKEVPFVTMGT